MGYPICLVEVYGEQEVFALASPMGGDAGRPYGDVPGSDLLRCRTEKRLASPAGVFELTLTYEPDAHGPQGGTTGSPNMAITLVADTDYTQQK